MNVGAIALIIIGILLAVGVVIAIIFGEKAGLTSITIPNAVTAIDCDTFGGCDSLTSVTIPYSVTEMAGDVFKGVQTIEDILPSQRKARRLAQKVYKKKPIRKIQKRCVGL